MILKIFNKNETRLFIVYLWTLPLEPAVSSLIVPPNGLIYSRVDYAKKNNKTVEPNMQILQFILRFISANIVCIVKSIPTKENPKRFCTVSNSPFSLFIPLKVKNNGARRCPWDTVDTACRFAAFSQHALGVTASHVLRFSGFVLLSYFQPHPNEKFQKSRGILRERKKMKKM